MKEVVKVRQLASYGMIQIPLPDGRRVHIYMYATTHPLHDHHNDLESTVLLGEIHEDQYADDGKTIVASRDIKQGETYFIKAETLHRVSVKPPVITILKDGRPSSNDRVRLFV
jgi:hypothetical protein